jgi:hypothetical protein
VAFGSHKAKLLSRNQVLMERNTYQEDMLELAQLKQQKYSNSAGLPDINDDSQKSLNQVTTKDLEHFNFLDSLRKKLNVESSKLIDLEVRISGMLFLYLFKF